MKVIVAEKCGFCHGVKNAIKMAEKILAEENEVYSLGSIIHNKDVVERLAKKGLKTVETVEEIPSGTVLIRSHGVRPEQIIKIRQKGFKIVLKGTVTKLSLSGTRTILKFRRLWAASKTLLS
jgi:4-hydroxy-3-methylbut-2-enyl diphosphate reductase